LRAPLSGVALQLNASGLGWKRTTSRLYDNTGQDEERPGASLRQLGLPSRHSASGLAYERAALLWNGKSCCRGRNCKTGLSWRAPAEHQEVVEDPSRKPHALVLLAGKLHDFRHVLEALTLCDESRALIVRNHLERAKIAECFWRASCPFSPFSKQEAFPGSISIDEFNAGSLQSAPHRPYGLVRN